jgi:HrpA-like RNA helicase
VAAESARLSRHAAALATSAAHASMRRTRDALPAAAKRGEVLTQLRDHVVLVISGATGCGKSTQVSVCALRPRMCVGACVCKRV